MIFPVPKTPKVILKRAFVDPDGEESTIDGMLPQQRNKATITFHDDGWVEVAWLELEDSKSANLWKWLNARGLIFALISASAVFWIGLIIVLVIMGLV